jgi:hypothetical protein
VTGSVNDIDLMIEPIRRGRRRSNGDTSLLLLDHVIHGGSALMDFAHAVDAPGVIEYSLGRGRLTGINMGNDADITNPL